MTYYVDGYVIPVPKKNLAAYHRLALKAAKIWREHGALEVRECAADDLAVHCGLPFPKLTKVKNGETVVFSWITFKSRAQRNRVNAAVMKDPRLTALCDPNKMLFDFQRMTYGGFKTMVAV